MEKSDESSKDDNDHLRDNENKTKKIQAIVFKIHISYAY